MSKMMILSVNLFLIFFSCCNAETLHFQDFEMLSCPHKRNITILIDGMNVEFIEQFLYSLGSLVQNEACFTINVYLEKDGYVVQWRPETNFNHFGRNGILESGNYGKRIQANEASDFIWCLYKERLMGNDSAMRQTFVYLVDFTYVSPPTRQLILLKFLKYERLWDVIIFCEYSENCPGSRAWKSIHKRFHRLFHFFLDDFNNSGNLWQRNLHLKLLFDALKEPNFDRYEYIYQYLLSRDDLFNETCTAGIDTINIGMIFPSDVYMPYFTALLWKVNAFRKKMRIIPLTIEIYAHFTFEFYSRWNLIKAYPILHYGFPRRRRNQVSFNVVDSSSESRSCGNMDRWELLSRPDIHHYRPSSVSLFGCYEKLKMKDYETPDDLLLLMNEELCRRPDNLP